MKKYKKYLNKYTYLLIGLIVLIVSSVLFIIPNFETEEFSQEVIEDIVEGITTTTVINTIQEDESNISSQEVFKEEDLQITEEEKVAIKDILIHNKEMNNTGCF